MSKWYSAATGGFYIPEVHTSLFTGSPGSYTPVGAISDAVEISDSTYAALSTGENDTQEITADGGGAPVLTARTVSDSAKWVDIRRRRDGRLIKCDYTQTIDWPGASQAAWATYRQELRDVPQDYSSDPDTVVWPTEPS